MTTSVASLRTSRRGPWTDLRFLLGILLIIASVAGVWVVVASARQTQSVYAAAHTIVAGTPLTEGDLEIVEVALGDMGGAYLAADALDGAAIATRTISAGELVPSESVGDAAAARTTSVVVRSTSDVPASVDEGAVVEVWAASLIERGTYEEPRILVADAIVVSVTRDDSMMGGGAASLELVIPRADVSAVLSAISADAAVSVVPASGARR